MLTYHLDMSNQEGIKLFKEVESLGTEFSISTSFITPEITYADEAKIQNYLRNDKRLDKYSRDIKDILEKKKHILSKEEENLLANLTEIISAPENTFDMLTNVEFKFGNLIDENGEEVKLTDSNYTLFLKNKNQEVRKQAFDLMYKKYSEFINTITEMYIANVKAKTTTAKLRKYELNQYVKLLGNIKETAKIYKVSDLTINCSIKEGLALTSYESVAMGVPVVSANVGGQAELINDEVGAVVPCLQKENEIMNFKYSEEEIDLYVEKIDHILNNLPQYKSNCRKRILEGFTIDHMVKKMEDQFEEIAKHPNTNKIETGKKLEVAKDVCKEFLTKSFITMNGEYEWLCNQVNEEYFGFSSKANGSSDSGYDYFKTPIGRLRLKMIAITKKMHIYEKVRSILRKIRRD